ncbi:hypothetical protein GCM10023194_21390 [Planotetraspora phitsanulokensis]|uniref:Uncharacterized protein n=1 Tax=Planotetraspora phitsanulokensis TaxID=575192 RepID=A0A8J3XE84_9ACTN|nr:hypothetical protein Pph01_32000 [Planotetraspora phitsanulokensis]
MVTETVYRKRIRPVLMQGASTMDDLFSRNGLGSHGRHHVAVNIFRRRQRGVRFHGDCPACGHDWREHPEGAFNEGDASTCGECLYEIEHGEPGAPSQACRLPAPPPATSDL